MRLSREGIEAVLLIDYFWANFFLSNGFKRRGQRSHPSGAWIPGHQSPSEFAWAMVRLKRAFFVLYSSASSPRRFFKL